MYVHDHCSDPLRLGLWEVTVDQVINIRSSSHIFPRSDNTFHFFYLHSSDFLDDSLIGALPLLLPFGDV